MRESTQAADGDRTELSSSIWQRMPPRRQLLAIGIAVVLLFAACSTATVRIGSWIAQVALGQNLSAAEGKKIAPLTWPADTAVLTVAVSPSMSETLQERADRFNSRKLRTSDGQFMRIDLLSMPPQELVEQSLRQPGFQAVAPDSSLWLRRIDRRWAEMFPTEQGSLPERRIGESTHFALSPDRHRHPRRSGPPTWLAESGHRLEGTPRPRRRRHRIQLVPSQCRQHGWTAGDTGGILCRLRYRPRADAGDRHAPRSAGLCAQGGGNS